MARTAAELAIEQEITGLKNLVWASPYRQINGNRHELNLTLHKMATDIIYQVNSEDRQPITRHVGEIILGASTRLRVEQVDFAAIQSKLTQSHTNSLFRNFISRFIGKTDTAVDTIHDVYCDNIELFAILKLPDYVDDAVRKQLFQPVFINAAWQLLLFFSQFRGQPVNNHDELLLPFALKQISVDGMLSGQTVMHLTPGNRLKRDNKYDVTFYDASGKPCLYLQELTLRTKSKLMAINI